VEVLSGSSTAADNLILPGLAQRPGAASRRGVMSLSRWQPLKTLSSECPSTPSGCPWNYNTPKMPLYISIFFPVRGIVLPCGVTVPAGRWIACRGPNARGLGLRGRV